jgi:dTDP-4-dehydrorhamnose 3,5-epimerase
MHPLTVHHDARGTFTEVFRRSWDTGVSPSQWNVVTSDARVLRGVHVHAVHDDWLVVAMGQATIGLVDLRPRSPTHRRACLLPVSGDVPNALLIPHGVAHGFYFHTRALHLYSVTHEFDPEDELGCRFDDPALGLAWPDPSPTLSPRDRALPPLAALVPALAARIASRRPA